MMSKFNSILRRYRVIACTYLCIYVCTVYVHCMGISVQEKSVLRILDHPVQALV